MDNIKIEKTSLYDFIAKEKNTIVIPEYQRPYAWEEEQVIALFEDLENFATEHADDINNDEMKSEYFLGSIVLFNDNNQNIKEVIDGQQRITSLILLLRAIYTQLEAIPKKNRNKEEKNFIRDITPVLWHTSLLTKEPDLGKTTLKSRVINESGNQVLQNILKTGEADRNAKDRYSKNYLKFLDLYKQKSAVCPISINSFIYVVLHCAILLPIIANSQETALTIFSTLNDRGLPLSDADIFKAKLYSNFNSEDEKKEFIETWQKLEEDALNCGETIQKLFVYYMIYLRGTEGDKDTSSPRLRTYFADGYKSKNDKDKSGKDKFNRLLNDKNLLNNLNLILNFLKVICNNEVLEKENETISWSEEQEIKQILDILDSYPNELWKYPAIGFYINHHKSNNFNQAFLLFLRKLAVELCTRYQENSSKSYTHYPILRLNVDVNTSMHPVFEEFGKVDFDKFLNTISTPHKLLERMVLKIISYNNPNQTTLLPNKWQVEHILPQKWRDNYFQNEEKIKENLQHIGNKIPLEAKKNIQANNGYFSKKKEYYKSSKIAIVQELATSDINDWDHKNIIDRDDQIKSTLRNLFQTWLDDYENNYLSSVNRNYIDDIAIDSSPVHKSSEVTKSSSISDVNNISKKTNKSNKHVVEKSIL